eukprot:COSAG02_NODE_4793_length_4973_cov_2.768158_3_plen_305_part_00
MTQSRWPAACGTSHWLLLLLGLVDYLESICTSLCRFPKYRTKVMGAITAEAQRGLKFIEMVAIPGGPVTQLEHRTMPFIIAGAVRDLRKKGVSISLLGDEETTEIKLFLRIKEYGEFIGRFYEKLQLSVSGMCLVAAAKKTQDQLMGSPEAIAEIDGLSIEDQVAVLKVHHYADLPTMTGTGMQLAAKAGKSQQDLLDLDEQSLSSLGLEGVDTQAITDTAAMVAMYKHLPISVAGVRIAAEARKSARDLLLMDEEALISLNLGPEVFTSRFVVEAFVRVQFGDKTPYRQPTWETGCDGGLKIK